MITYECCIFKGTLLVGEDIFWAGTKVSKKHFFVFKSERRFFLMLLNYGQTSLTRKIELHYLSHLNFLPYLNFLIEFRTCGARFPGAIALLFDVK